MTKINERQLLSKLYGAIEKGLGNVFKGVVREVKVGQCVGVVGYYFVEFVDSGNTVGNVEKRKPRIVD